MNDDVHNILRDVTTGNSRILADDMEVDRNCSGSGSICEKFLRDGVVAEVLFGGEQPLFRDRGTTFPVDYVR